MARKSIKFQVIWASPRGFANEGSYIHGSESDLNTFCENFDYTSGVITVISSHRNSGTAATTAYKLARRDRKNTPKCEVCNIDSFHVSKVLDQQDEE